MVKRTQSRQVEQAAWHPGILELSTDTPVLPNRVTVEYGLGGSGGEAVRNQPAPIDDLETVRLLLQDTDSEHTHDLPAASKLIHGNYFAAEAIEEYLKAPWRLGVGVDRLELYQQALGAAGSLDSGARTNRVAGEQYVRELLADYVRLKNFYLNPVQQLLQRHQQVCVQQGMSSRSIEVLLRFVAGSGGGTGSSLAWIMPLFAKHVTANQAGIAYTTLRLELILPGVLAAAAPQPDQIQANSFAVLREIDYLFRANPNQLGAVKTNAQEIALRSPSQHGVTLYDSPDEFQRVFGSRKDVVAARNKVAFYRDIYGPTAATYNARITDAVIEPRKGKIFSSAGVCEWQIPWERMLHDFGFRTALAVIPQLIQQDTQGDRELELKQAWQSLEGSVPGVEQVPELRRDRRGEPIEIDVQPLEQSPRGQINTVTAFVLEQLPELRVRLQECSESERQLRQQQLIVYFERLLNTRGGWLQATHILGRLDETVEHLADDLKLRLQRSESQIRRVQSEIEQLQQTVQTRRGVWRPGTRYRQLAQDLVIHLVSRERYQVQQQFLAAWAGFLEQLRHRTTRFHQTLEQLVGGLERQRREYLEEYERGRNISVQDILCSQEIDDWYRPKADEAIEVVRSQVSIRWFDDNQAWGLSWFADQDFKSVAISSEAGRKLILEHASKPWLWVQSINALEALQRQGWSAEAVFAEMSHQSAPMITLKDARTLPDAPFRMRIWAAETTDWFDSLPQETGRYHSATGDPSRVVMLQFLVGFELSQLRRYDDYRRAYLNARRQGRHMHIFPELFDFQEEDLEASEAADELVYEPMADGLGGHNHAWTQ